MTGWHWLPATIYWLSTPDTLASLSVGNGEFAFTTDVTGLQTFYKEYENGVTLGTQSNWGWHTFPITENYQVMESAKYSDYRGRKVPYLVQFPSDGRDTKAANYFRENPQRLQLGVNEQTCKPNFKINKG